MIRNKLIAIFALTAMVAMLQTAQATITLADLAPGGTISSISIDDKTFSGFGYTPSGLTSFDPTQVIVTATESGGIEYLTWSGNISVVSSGSGTAGLQLKYIVTANAGTINAIDQSYDGSAQNGLLTVDETVAIGAFGGQQVGKSHLDPGDPSDPNFSDPLTEANDLLDIVPPQTVLYVTKDIVFNLTSEAGGFIIISRVTQSFHQVPEPTTMIAGALLLLPFGASTLRILRKRQMP
jgi:hypothetical protein